jgi:hypothetical protein
MAYLRPDDVPQKCPHGYWLHAYLKCPWCFGWTTEHHGVIPLEYGKKGNGWLLKKGEPVCECGGPAGAGWGILPDWVKTAEDRERHRRSIKKCIQCAREGGN